MIIVVLSMDGVSTTYLGVRNKALALFLL